MFFRFSGEKIVLCILKGKMAFKMYNKKNHQKICVPTLTKIYQTCYPKQAYFICFAFDKAINNCVSFHKNEADRKIIDETLVVFYPLAKLNGYCFVSLVPNFDSVPIHGQFDVITGVILMFYWCNCNVLLV